MTISKEEEDILRSYELGASGFVVKPITLQALGQVMEILGKYWLEIVELPPCKP